MIYSIPYVALVILFGFASVYAAQAKTEEAKKQISMACAGVLIFFFGFRGYICDDWQIYVPSFEYCSKDIITFHLFKYADKWSFEPGFTLLMYFCKSFVNNYFFFQAVCSIINVLLLYRFLSRRTNNIPLGILLFLCFGGYGMMTNMMRNSIAILIFVNAIEYLEKRKPLPYFALCFVALTFHTTSLIYFPIYFFFHLRCNKWIYLAIFIIGNAIFITHISIFSQIAYLLLGDSESKLSFMAEAYTSGQMAEPKGISIGYLERLLTGTLIFCYFDKLKEVNASNKIFINCFIGYVVMFFYFSEFQAMSERLGNLFVVAYWILWADFLKCFSYDNNKKLFIAFMTIYCTMKMVGLTNLRTSEYDNVLFGVKNFQERLYIHNRFEGQH